jgi:hypothetical protein
MMDRMDLKGAVTAMGDLKLVPFAVDRSPVLALLHKTTQKLTPAPFLLIAETGRRWRGCLGSFCRWQPTDGSAFAYCAGVGVEPNVKVLIAPSAVLRRRGPRRRGPPPHDAVIPEIKPVRCCHERNPPRCSGKCRFDKNIITGPMMPAMARKTNGIGRGGKRPGAGRPPGAKNKRSKAAELVAKAKAEALEMPVDRLLRRMNDTSLPEMYRDELARYAAPYVSARLNSIAITKRPAQMNDEEIAQMIGLTEEDMLRLGIGRDKWPRPLH